MIQGVYNQKDLDTGELEAAGIYKDGRILLENEDIEALLAGRRTQMTELKDLYFDGFHISSLNAKLSLKGNPGEKPRLMIHPLYLEKLAPEYLTEDEAESLEEGKVSNLEKTITDKNGRKKEVLIEFDRETNEYLVTDTSQVITPDMVNGEHLSPEQKARYRKGKEVELEDGTRFQYAATEREGIRSNKIALIASLVVDGGLSFMVFLGLKALFGEQHNAKAAQLSEGYRQAMNDMHQQRDGLPEWMNLNGQQPDKEYSRGYGRSGKSR